MDIRLQVIEYLASHPYMQLATVDPKGQPMAHTVAYASEGPTVYFITDAKSRKAKNMAANPSVAFVVDEDYSDLGEIRGVQILGRASVVKDKAQASRILALMAMKFPDFGKVPHNPSLVIFKVEPAEATFIDNTKGFGHRDTVKF